MNETETTCWYVLSENGEHYLYRTWDYDNAVQLSIDGFVVKPAN